ncbi:unnamed protein product [Effrenium voratum]|uniref:Uncharacterized protein n=1 Tax=Effrenium voratum TaxID=2562239 RepID=A0AA36MLQ7_9DINO|nr:unnamed protein product [Effrenium voratum]CAJ1432101.1 unnamed protein product [Effrenium voratum]
MAAEMPCAEAAVDSAEAKVLPHDAAEQEQDDQAAGESLNKASLMTAISAVLKDRDLHSFCMKDLRSALEQYLSLEEGTLLCRKQELAELAKEEVQRLMEEPKAKARTKGSRPKRKAPSEDWRRLLRKADRAEGGSQGDIRPEEVEPSLTAEVGGQSLELTGKVFASGSLGYHGCARLTLEIGGQPQEVMCQISCAVLGKAPEPQDQPDVTPDVDIAPDAQEL